VPLQGMRGQVEEAGIDSIGCIAYIKRDLGQGG
jgi:hypothetical protein